VGITEDIVCRAIQRKSVNRKGCHELKHGVNKLSDRCSLLTPALPPEEGKRRKRERDLQIQYKIFTNNTNNTINNKRNNVKYTKLIHWHPFSSCQAAPGSPRLDSAADRSWTPEFTDGNLDQNCR